MMFRDMVVTSTVFSFMRKRFFDDPLIFEHSSDISISKICSLLVEKLFNLFHIPENHFLNPRVLVPSIQRLLDI